MNGRSVRSGIWYGKLRRTCKVKGSGFFYSDLLTSTIKIILNRNGKGNFDRHFSSAINPSLLCMLLLSTPKL